MRHLHTICIALSLTVAMSSPSLPATSAAAVTNDDARCRAALGAGAMKVAATIARGQEKCHKTRLKGGEPDATDCNDPAALDAATQARIANAELAAAEMAAERCTVAAAPVDNGYWVCPGQCSTIVIDAYDDVASCIACTAHGGAAGAAAAALGHPGVGGGDDAMKCQAALARALRKFLRKRLKLQRKCQTRQDRDRLDSAVDCRTGDGGDALDRVDEKTDRLVARCTDAALAGLDSCAADVAGTSQCLREAGAAAGDALFRGAMHRNPRLAELEPKLTSEKWVLYAPSGFDPTLGCPAGFPDQSVMEADLENLHDAGFTGVITSGFDCELKHVARIAREVGFSSVIVGLFLFNDALRIEEVANVITECEHIDGVGVGNEGLLGCGGTRYSAQTLLETMLEVRDATGKPVASSEQIEDYIDGGGCLGGLLHERTDWAFPITHPFNNGITDPLDGAAFTVARHAQLEAITDRPILHKETGWPTAMAPGATEANQEAYFVALAQTSVPFTYFEHIDLAFKDSPPHEAFWGLWRADGTPKPFIAGNAP